MGSETRSVGSHWAAPARMPADSPGKLRPVGLPKPRFFTWARRRDSPSEEAISEVPMFEDCARIWVAVNSSVGCGSASWNKEPSKVIWSGTEKAVFGLMRPSWRAAEKVTSLKTDPGS